MIKSLWIKFFFLLITVAVIALSAAFLLRELMVKDFEEFLEGEMEDRVYWVTASLESSFEKFSGWDRAYVIKDTVWALMLGFDMNLYDTKGTLIVDTQIAIDSLSPLVRKRIMAISERRSAGGNNRYLPYVLFLGGKEIGRLEVRFLRPKKGGVFIRRSNRLLLFSLFALGGAAALLSVIFSRKLTNPLRGLTGAVLAVGEGDLKRRVAISGEDEIGRLSGAFNRMAQALEIQESLRKKMTSDIAHELRTPISAIRGELEGMMDGLIPLDTEHLQSLHSEIGRLGNIVEGIEELSQAEASRLMLKKQSFELKPFLSNIAERFKKIFQDKEVALDFECEAGLVINADPDRLSQIIINLLSNALRAEKNGGSVWIKASRKGSETVIEVIDDGHGISEKDIPFIFERFYRAGSGGDGLGLGLTIVKELVEAHGGRVTARSEYGKGSAFTISFPLARLHNSS
jgi:two-component system sensor histidine kinase BaeS